MDPKYVIREQIDLTLAGAQAIVLAAIAKAREIEVDECIAVVDRGGTLPSPSRAWVAPALARAHRAHQSGFRRDAAPPTAEENAGDVELGIRLAIAADGAVTNIGGGLPIVVDGQVVGGIGISSGTVDDDIVVAQAGLVPLV